MNPAANPITPGAENFIIYAIITENIVMINTVFDVLILYFKNTDITSGSNTPTYKFIQIKIILGIDGIKCATPIATSTERITEKLIILLLGFLFINLAVEYDDMFKAVESEVIK